jgi:hypothetical protein
MDQDKVTPLLSGRTYDIFVWLVKIVLPAAGTFYFAMSGLWGLPAAEQVIGTCTALSLFLGIILQISNKSYDASGEKYSGEVIVTTNQTGEETHSLSFNAPLADLIKNADGEITLKIQKNTDTSELPSV